EGVARRAGHGVAEVADERRVALPPGPGEEVLRVEERVVLDADARLARRRLPASGRRRRPAEPAGAVRLAGSDPAGRRAGAVALLTDLDDVVPAARRWTGAPWLA